MGEIRFKLKDQIDIKKRYTIRFYFTSGRIFFTSGSLIRLGKLPEEKIAIIFNDETNEWHIESGDLESDFIIKKNYKNRKGGTIYSKNISNAMLSFIEKNIDKNIIFKDSATFIIGEKINGKCQIITKSCKYEK